MGAIYLRLQENAINAKSTGWIPQHGMTYTVLRLTEHVLYMRCQYAGRNIF